MSDQPLPNVPDRSQMLDESGMLTLAWKAFFRGLYIRVGQARALTNTELEALSGGAAMQAEIDALTATVTANKTSSDSNFNGLSQGPYL